MTFKEKHTLARLYDSISMKVCYSFLCLTWKANLYAVTEGRGVSVCVWAVVGICCGLAKTC